MVSIAKSYEKRAVPHRHLADLRKGEVLGLLGPNGAGKTTCFTRYGPGAARQRTHPDGWRRFNQAADCTSRPFRPWLPAAGNSIFAV